MSDDNRSIWQRMKDGIEARRADKSPPDMPTRTTRHTNLQLIDAMRELRPGLYLLPPFVAEVTPTHLGHPEPGDRCQWNWVSSVSYETAPNHYSWTLEWNGRGWKCIRYEEATE